MSKPVKSSFDIQGATDEFVNGLGEALSSPEEIGQKIEKILGSSGVGFVIFDDKWNYLYVSGYASAHIGRPPEELLGKCIWTLFPYAISSPFYNELIFSAKEFKPAQLEVFYPEPGVWMQHDGYPSQMGYVLFGRDITEKKQEEERLKKSETTFRLMAEGIPQIVWTSDANGNIDYCNQHWHRYTGLIPNQSYGSGWQKVVHPEDLPHTIEQWEKAIKNGGLFEVEYRLRRGSDGQYCWHLGRAHPLYDQNGKIIKWFGTSTDITDQKKVQKQVLEMNQRLIHLNQVKSEFTSMVSHELRTPLTTIREGIALILDGIDGPVTKEQKETLRITNDNVNRLAKLINSVLDFSRIESGKLDLYLEKIDLKQLIITSCELMKMVAKKKDITVLCQLPVNPLIAVCDSDKIKQVIINLIDNAIKFTDKKGEIKIQLSQNDGDAIISVEDTGIGIQEEDQERIFEMYVQSSLSRERAKTGGVGAGLAICKKLIEQHRGKIQVMSTYGKGSTFTVTFPSAL